MCVEGHAYGLVGRGVVSRGPRAIAGYCVGGECLWMEWEFGGGCCIVVPRMILGVLNASTEIACMGAK